MSLSLFLAAFLGLGLARGEPTPSVTVTIDSSRHELIVTNGPFDLPNMPPRFDPIPLSLSAIPESSSPPTTLLI